MAEQRLCMHCAIDHARGGPPPAPMFGGAPKRAYTVGCAGCDALKAQPAYEYPEMGADPNDEGRDD